jgi:DNA-binding transcriptional regulator YiaG
LFDKNVDFSHIICMGYQTNTDFRAALKRFSLSQRQFAILTDTDISAVNRWALGKARVPGVAWALIKLLDHRPELVQVIKEL